MLIDCHNHSLPYIDDGAHDMQMALLMAKTSIENGVSDIIVTPHHFNGVFKNPKTNILQAIKEYRAELNEQNLQLNVHSGSELHLAPEIISQILDGEAMTYCDKGKAVLVEPPKHHLPRNAIDSILEQLLYNGLTPIIAHPERNSTLLQNNDALIEWVNWGCKTQLTAMSCTGKFGERLQQTSLNWIAQGIVHIIASDCHRPSGRSPKLKSAYDYIETAFNQKTANCLFQQNPQKLIDGNILSDLSPQDIKTQLKKHGFLDKLFNRH